MRIVLFRKKKKTNNKWILKFNLALDFEQWTFNNLETLQRMSPNRLCVFHALHFLHVYLYFDAVSFIFTRNQALRA